MAKRRLTLISIQCIDLVNDWTYDRIKVYVNIDGKGDQQVFFDSFYFEPGSPVPINQIFDFDSEVEITVKDFEFKITGRNVENSLGTQEVSDVLTDQFPPLKFTGLDAEYEIRFFVTAVLQPADDKLPIPGGEELLVTTGAFPVPEFMKADSTPAPGSSGPPDNPVFRGNLKEDKKDKFGNPTRWILSIDGGGTRGIIPLLNLMALERYYGQPISKIFDMVAGSSTGGVIAAGLATGRTLDFIISKYDDLATRRELFTSNKNNQIAKLLGFKIPGDPAARTVQDLQTEISGYVTKAFLALAAIDIFTFALGGYILLSGTVTLGGLAPFGIALALAYAVLVAALNVALVPIVTGDVAGKLKNLIAQLATLVFVPKYKDSTKFTVFDGLFSGKRLRDCDMDILITGKDMFRGETMYLSCFKDRASGSKKGTFKEMLVSAALKATSAAPTYFSPANVMVDGGVGSFNNPSFAAAIEALYYSHKEGIDPGGPLENKGFYEEGKTVVWSFGTANVVTSFTAQNLLPNPSLDAMERTDMLPFWLKYIVNDAFDSANEQQNYLNRALLGGLMGKIEFRRFNIFLGPEILKQIGLSSSPEARIKNVRMDAVEGAYVSLREIALSFAEHVWKEYFSAIERKKVAIEAKNRKLMASTDPGKTAQLQAELDGLVNELAVFRAQGVELGKPDRSGTFTTYVTNLIRDLNQVRPVAT